MWRRERIQNQGNCWCQGSPLSCHWNPRWLRRLISQSQGWFSHHQDPISWKFRLLGYCWKRSLISHLQIRNWQNFLRISQKSPRGRCCYGLRIHFRRINICLNRQAHQRSHENAHQGRKSQTHSTSLGRHDLNVKIRPWRRIDLQESYQSPQRPFR
jgi:hypothetical protein